MKISRYLSWFLQRSYMNYKVIGQEAHVICWRPIHSPPRKFPNLTVVISNCMKPFCKKKICRYYAAIYQNYLALLNHLKAAVWYLKYIGYLNANLYRILRINFINLYYHLHINKTRCLQLTSQSLNFTQLVAVNQFQSISCSQSV